MHTCVVIKMPTSIGTGRSVDRTSSRIHFPRTIVQQLHQAKFAPGWEVRASTRGALSLVELYFYRFYEMHISSISRGIVCLLMSSSIIAESNYLLPFTVLLLFNVQLLFNYRNSF